MEDGGLLPSKGDGMELIWKDRGVIPPKDSQETPMRLE